MGQRSLASVVLALTVIGCSTTAPTPSTTSSASASTTAAASPGDLPTFAPGQSLPPAEVAPLPKPTLTDAGGIGAALFDPNHLTDGVVSLLALMGVEIAAADGSVVQPGRDNGAGRLVLTEAEVHGLIAMAREDLAAMSEAGAGGIELGDIFAAIQPSLPAGYTLDDLAAGYADAYAESPNALVPQVLLGQPVDGSEPLTRLQAWLIFIDGFVGAGATATTVAWVETALTGPTLGAARGHLPTLTSQISGVSNAEWAYLLSRMPTLAFTIPFTTWPPGSVHEGHGGPGAPATILADIVLPVPLVYPQTGHVLLEPLPSPAGVTVEWSSTHQGTLTRHGSLSRALLTPVVTDAGGQVTNTYTPKSEPANGRGAKVKEVASLFAQASAADLISHAYFIPASGGATTSLLGMVHGKVRSTRGEFPIEWHEKDTYEVTIRNSYDVVLDAGTGTGSLVNVHRVGLDKATGIIFNNGDGTYRGTLEATVDGTMDGTSFVGECHDATHARQSVYVVGHEMGGMGVLPPFFRLQGGTYAQKDLMLHFYPASAPAGTLGACQGTLEFPGGGPDGQPGGVMIPFNDTRFTAIFNTTNWQDGLGVRLLLPTEGTLDWTDTRQVLPDLKVDSRWSIQVTKLDAP